VGRFFLFIGRNYFLSLGFSKLHSEIPFEGDRMKKLFVFVCALVLGTTLSIAQTAGTTGTAAPTTKPAGKKHHHRHHHHKGKKGGAAATTAPK